MMIRIRTFVFAVLVLAGALLLFGTGPNGSTDGRYHTCGYVTEQGVTEHLDAYHERCGN